MKKAFFVVFLSVLVGCTTTPDITAWNMAKEVNTPAAYEDFIRRYPQSSHVGKARELIDQSKREQIKKADSVAQCIQIMESNPDPKTAAMVADLAFEAARRETSPEALYAFLAYFKGHIGAPEVRNRLEELEFENAKKEASPLAMEYFLMRYPTSRFAGEGRRLHAEKTYQQVKKWGNPFGYKAFLRRFPDSHHAAEIRGLLRPSRLRMSVFPDTGETLSEAIERSPFLRKHACALKLSSKIREGAEEADSLRQQLYELEKGTAPDSLPAACSSMGHLRSRPDGGGDLAGALQILGKVEEQRKDLAGKWETYRQRAEIIKAAIVASSTVADELEAAELTEEVLGSGPLGGLDTGAEKGSLSAKKALERFRVAEEIVKKNRDDINSLLLETDGFYRALQLYIVSNLEVK